MVDFCKVAEALKPQSGELLCRRNYSMLVLSLIELLAQVATFKCPLPWHVQGMTEPMQLMQA